MADPQVEAQTGHLPTDPAIKGELPTPTNVAGTVNILTNAAKEAGAPSVDAAAAAMDVAAEHHEAIESNGP